MQETQATAKTEPLAYSQLGFRTRLRRGWRRFRRIWPLYLFVAPMIVYFIVFHYYPMYGVQIAFKNFIATLGIWNSPWVGFDHFERFFGSLQFGRVIKNTLLINLYQLILFPIPIVIALSLNEVGRSRFKKLVQTVTFAPHFISVVVMVGIILVFLNPETGIVNLALQALGFPAISFMTQPGWFKSIFVWSGEWQNMGWGSIIYLAALSGIDPQLHEAAKMDGASRVQRIWHINVPGIMPTIIILLILNMGSFMSLGFEKVYLMQNQLNMDASDVIQTYVYRSGILGAQYSFSAAVGLFNNAINFALLVIFNQLARRTGTSLW
jgi:putative aldouronate transport system permease protein